MESGSNATEPMISHLIETNQRGIHPKGRAETQRNIHWKKLLGMMSVVAASAALASCQNNFVIEPTSNGSLIFKNVKLLGSSQFSPCLTWLVVYDLTGEEREVWRIQASGARCRKVAIIPIGSRPTGFSFKGVAPMRGHRIRVAARDGDGRYGSSQEFAY